MSQIEERGKPVGFFLDCDNFRDGCAVLEADEVGVYVLMLTVLYQRKECALPDDDAFVARATSRSVRVWRRVKQRLLELGKIHIRDGYIFNGRASYETDKKAARSERAKAAGRMGGRASGKARSARKPEAETPEFRQSLPEVSPKFGDSFAETSRKLSPNSHAITNEIKAGTEPISSTSVDVDNDAYASSSTSATPLKQNSPVASAKIPAAAWDQRMLALRLRFGAILGASPNAQSAKFLRELCEPHHGVPCDWECDVEPALEHVLGRYLAKNETVESLGVVRNAALHNRDRRLAGLPAPKPFTGAEHASPAISRQRRGTGSLVDAAVRALDRMGRAQADAGPAAGCIDGEIAPARLIGAA